MNLLGLSLKKIADEIDVFQKYQNLGKLIDYHELDSFSFIFGCVMVGLIDVIFKFCEKKYVNI